MAVLYKPCFGVTSMSRYSQICGDSRLYPYYILCEIFEALIFRGMASKSISLHNVRELTALPEATPARYSR